MSFSFALRKTILKSFERCNFKNVGTFMNFTVKDVSKCFLKSSELMNFVICTAFGPIFVPVVI